MIFRGWSNSLLADGQHLKQGFLEVWSWFWSRQSGWCQSNCHCWWFQWWLWRWRGVNQPGCLRRSNHQTSQSSNHGPILDRPTLKSWQLPTSTRKSWRPQHILRSWQLQCPVRFMLPRIEAVIGRPIGKLQGEDKSLCVSVSRKSLFLFQANCHFVLLSRTLQQHVRAERKIQRLTPERKFLNPEIFLPGFCFYFLWLLRWNINS